MNNHGELLLPDIGRWPFLLRPKAEIRLVLSYVWLRKVGWSIHQRFEYPVDRVLCPWTLGQATQHLDPQSTALVRKIVVGTFYSGEHTSHFADTGLCRHCGAPDSDAHRLEACPATQSCRVDLPPQWQTWPAHLRRRLIPLRASSLPPLWAARLPPLRLTYHLPPTPLPDELHLFTDGSCHREPILTLPRQDGLSSLPIPLTFGPSALSAYLALSNQLPERNCSPLGKPSCGLSMLHLATARAYTGGSAVTNRPRSDLPVPAPPDCERPLPPSLQPCRVAPYKTCGARGRPPSAPAGPLRRPRSRRPTAGDSHRFRQAYRVTSQLASGGRSSWGYLSPVKPSPFGGIFGTRPPSPRGCHGSNSRSASSSLLAAYRHPLTAGNSGGWA